MPTTQLLEDVMEKLMTDPKCSEESKAEYKLIANQVLLVRAVVVVQQ